MPRGLTFPLLSDPERKVLTAYGAYGEKKMYGKTVQGVIRSTFVVDEKGKIAEAQYNVKATGHVAKSAPRPVGLTALHRGVRCHTLPFPARDEHGLAVASRVSVAECSKLLCHRLGHGRATRHAPRGIDGATKWLRPE